MIRVRTGSRLHFGVLSLRCEEPSASYWANLDGEPTLPARWFGGVGLMVEHPGVQVAVRPASAWSAEGPLGERALAFARRYASSLTDAGPPSHVIVEAASREHVGLGTGTQLGLAVARALERAWQRPEETAAILARRVGRGLRSALGIHGFDHGGLLVEGGKTSAGAVAPLVARVAFPEEWRIILAVPSGESGLHGHPEHYAFQRLSQGAANEDGLCRIILLGLLPAIVEGDLVTFAEALFDFNARVGELFAPVQGGRYASARIGEMLRFLRQSGIKGVGQSSWGPAVFAVVGCSADAEVSAARLRARFGLADAEVFVTQVRNSSALVEAATPPSLGA